jgi:hypothetical protein
MNGTTARCSLACALIALVAMQVMAVAPAQAADPPARVALSAEVIQAQLAALGLKYEQPRPDTYVVEMGVADIRFALYDRGRHLGAYFAFKAPGASLDKANQWNSEQLYSRAYLDEDGDPVLRAELLADDGLTPAMINQFIQHFRVSIADYVQKMQ